MKNDGTFVKMDKIPYRDYLVNLIKNIKGPTDNVSGAVRLSSSSSLSSLTDGH